MAAVGWRPITEARRSGSGSPVPPILSQAATRAPIRVGVHAAGRAVSMTTADIANDGARAGQAPVPAICLMRAIISVTACSTDTLSLITRLIAFAHTFSLFTIVNL